MGLCSAPDIINVAAQGGLDRLSVSTPSTFSRRGEPIRGPSAEVVLKQGDIVKPANGPKRRKKRMLVRKKRTLDPAIIIDYKNPDVLKRFITDRGKIIPRRISGASQAQQKLLAVAIKRARFLSLLPSSVAHRTERGFSGEVQNVIQTFVSSSMRGGRGGARGQDAPRSGAREQKDGSSRDSRDSREREEAKSSASANPTAATGEK